MRRSPAAILVLAISLALLATINPAKAHPEKIEPGLRAELAAAEPADTFRVWAIFRDRPEIDPVPEDRLPPVDSGYVELVGSTPGVIPRHVDELLNPLSLEATPSAIYPVAALPFVTEIQPVPAGCAVPEGCDPRPPSGTGSVDIGIAALSLILSVPAGVAAIGVTVRSKRFKERSGVQK